MMLFLVGMELDPKSLWAMRVRLLGLGGLQVTLTAAAATCFAWFLGMAWQTAVAVGFLFSLSSTALVLQTLTERGLVKTEGGQSAFSVLLFQDIAVIPMLAGSVGRLSRPWGFTRSARRMTHSFIASEKAHEDQLFDTWRNIEEGIHFSPRYGELFMKLEEALDHAMREDARLTEDETLAWTPPKNNG